jgi:hypothetical protein
MPIFPDTFPRPPFVTDEHLEFLDDLRESGETNMFGARPYLAAAFPALSEPESSKALSYWMASFSERHPR